MAYGSPVGEGRGLICCIWESSGGGPRFNLWHMGVQWARAEV